MVKLDIEDLITAEREFFKPMILRAERVSEQELLEWRRETVRERQERISLEVFNLTGGEIRYGPFKGSKLLSDPWWGRLDLGSQCLGLYEIEVLRFFSEIVHGEYRRFIDIGAADGYYTTGALVSGKFNEAISFEVSSAGRAAIEQSWVHNGSPGSLTIFGEATPEAILDLGEQKLRDSFVLIDIEGGEFDLLTGSVLSAMSQSTLVLEIHNWVEFFLEKYSDFLRRASVHFEIDLVERVERPTFAVPELRDFTDDNRQLLVSERRPCAMRFLKLSPRT